MPSYKPTRATQLDLSQNKNKRIKLYFGFLVFEKALKTKYFSNRPGPTPGCQLPRPNCPVEALKEPANPTVATKRKRAEALEQGKDLH